MAASDTHHFTLLKKPFSTFSYRQEPRATATKPVFPEEDSSSDDEGQESYYKELVAKVESEVESLVLDPRDKDTVDGWIKRNPTMVRQTGNHPFNSEPPLNRLMHYGFITPVPLHFVRNHGAVPKGSWSEWTVEVTGLVARPTVFTMDQLVNSFPSVEFPVTILCAGHRRKEVNMTKQTMGFNWGAGAISTNVWKGVRLRDILKRCGIFSSKKGALNVCFDGAEPNGGGTNYGTSMKKELAMDPAHDMILAYKQNGEFLTPDHGFPVRMIIPGCTGGRMVKWVNKIMVTTEESDNYYHFRDNRFLPPHVDAELANSEAWWHKPEYIINDMNINSVITTPSHEEMLVMNSSNTRKPYTMKGYAYSGGGKKVTRVEVTMDDGKTWQVCTLEHPEKPSKYGKYWCWCFWSLDVEVLDLLVTKDIMVRAWDDTMNTQPENQTWNLLGMMNNSWFRIKTKVCRSDGDIGIVFEHPIVPGNESGGWMQSEENIVEVKPPISNKKTNIKNISFKAYTLSEVKKHNTEDSAWLIVHGQIYDCTHYLKDHPGGAASILIHAGTDCTSEFDAVHSDTARKILEEYRIGELVGESTSSDYTSDSSSSNDTVLRASNITHSDVSYTPKRKVALVPHEKIQCKLIAKTSLSHDVRLFRFALPSDDQITYVTSQIEEKIKTHEFTGLFGKQLNKFVKSCFMPHSQAREGQSMTLGQPVGKHILLCATIDEKLCKRAFTPTSNIDEVGYFELVVKVYFKGVNPKFPNGGLMSQYLDSLPLGSVVDVKGPLGHIEYTGRGNFLVHGQPKFAKKLAMVAGGTGITPIYQVVQAILADPKDQTEMFVVYANRTEDDILLRQELDGWAKTHERLKVWYVVNESIREGWKYGVGFINESIMREHLPNGSKNVLALACGPSAMIKLAVQPNLEKMKYDVKNNFLIF